MGHLAPFSMTHKISDLDVTISVSFGSHVFTDKKGLGPLLYPRQARYFSEARYERSLELAKLIRDKFIDSYVIPYIDKDNNEVYHYMEIYDYAIFFDLRRKSDNELKLIVISAYELDEWGATTLPTGKRIRARYIATLRLNGETYFGHKKKRRP